MESWDGDYFRTTILIDNVIPFLKNFSKDVFHYVASQHSIRRTDWYWAGLSQDLIIEQLFNLCLKTNGGLLHATALLCRS